MLITVKKQLALLTIQKRPTLLTIQKWGWETNLASCVLKLLNIHGCFCSIF
jgi:hypothetical protein